MLPRLLSPFVLGGLLGLPAAGAALPELLRRLPAEVLQVEVYPRPKALEDRGRALGRKFESTGSWLDLRAETGLEVAHLAGPLVMGEVPGPDGGAIRFVLAPLQDPRGALRTVKAKARSNGVT